MPIGDVFAVGAPAESVTAAELFFIHPVKRSVDYRVAAVVGYALDVAGREIFDIYVVLRHIGHIVSVGREFGEHQRRFGKALAQLTECAVVEIEHPIVAAGVVTPYTPGVGIDKHFVIVVAPDYASYGNVASCRLVDEHRRRYYDFTTVVLGTIGNDIHSAGSFIGLKTAVALSVLHPVYCSAATCWHEVVVDDILK